MNPKENPMTQILRSLPADAVFEHGAHREDGAFCLLEATAYVVGEPWTDHPATACPVQSDSRCPACHCG